MDRREPEGFGDEQAVRGILGEAVRLAIVEDLAAVLDLAEEDVPPF